MSATDELLANNEAYVAAFDKGDLPLPPAKKVAVVACMDARLNVYGALGLSEGDAHVIRNAGGVVTDDEIRSLAISQRLLGTEEIILIHHTDCGMLTFTDDDVQAVDPGRDRHQARVGGRGVRRPRRRRAPVDRPDQGLARSSRARTRVRGFVYEVETGAAARGQLGSSAALSSRSSWRSNPAFPTWRTSSGRPSRAAARSAAARVAGVGRWASHTTRV